MLGLKSCQEAQLLPEQNVSGGAARRGGRAESGSGGRPRRRRGGGGEGHGRGTWAGRGSRPPGLDRTDGDARARGVDAGDARAAAVEG